MALAAPFPAARPTLSGSRAAARSTRSNRMAPPRGTASRPQAATPAGIRLTRRGRVAVILASTVVLFVAVAASGLVTAEADVSPRGAATAVVVVQPGETLWQIAKSVAPSADPRETVVEIRELNGLDAQAVVPGQSLVVPAV